jgi:hypothetical protein
MNSEDLSYKEKRIRGIIQLYYSRPEISKVIFEFSKNREVIPRYFEGFGKRPDSIQYQNDIFELVRKGATSFHCSEEIWRDPLEIQTGMNEEQLNELRVGWDLLIDIDSRYIDYSKILAELIIQLLKFHGIENIGIKFSGSKGFHIIIPWKAFPKEINGIKTSDKFPEWPRIITKYIMEKTKEKLIEKISDIEKPNKYVKDFRAPKEVMPDLILVSPRHLFRMPYSLHEKTALSSIVLNPDSESIKRFELKDADPMKLSESSIRNFIPNANEEEASELLIQALDWYNEKNPEEEKKYEFKNTEPIKINNLSDKNFPLCIKRILEGLEDGKKRALFVLINLFRSIDMDKNDIEKRIEEWNKKNKPPLKRGYIQSQLSWAYKRKPLMPPNCGEFYQGLGVCKPDDFCKLIKNPINYIIKKSFLENKKSRKYKKKD